MNSMLVNTTSTILAALALPTTTALAASTVPLTYLSQSSIRLVNDSHIVRR